MTEDVIIKPEHKNQYTVHNTELKSGVSLTCISTDKFKAGCITVNLLCRLSRETAASNALLPRVLLRGSVNHPDMESIAAALDDLYGVRVEPIIRKKGELQCVGFYVDFPDDRYIPGDESILEKAINIVCELLLSPAMKDGLLRGDYIESEKSNLIDDIRAVINDKRGYSIDRLLEEMCSGEAFGVSKLGSESEALAITDKSLTAHYNELIRDSKIEVLYCGSAEPERVETAFCSSLHGLSGRTDTEIPKTNVLYEPVIDKVRRFNETLDVSQGKLTMGFRMGSAMKAPDYPAFMVLNALYGGGVTSKLFLNVRERLSLCYYASSMIDKHKGIMLVASGIEFSKFDTAFGEILTQLDNIKKGDISDWELTSAKRSIVTSVKSALDSPGGLEELYFDSAVCTVPYDPAELGNSVESVTLGRAIDAAADIKLDSVYFFSGKEDKEGGDGA